MGHPWLTREHAFDSWRVGQNGAGAAKLRPGMWLARNPTSFHGTNDRKAYAWRRRSRLASASVATGALRVASSASAVSHESFADDVIHGRLDEGCRNCLIMPVAVAVVGDEVLVGIDVRAELLHRFQDLPFCSPDSLRSLRDRPRGLQPVGRLGTRFRAKDSISGFSNALPMMPLPTSSRRCWVPTPRPVP